MELKDTAEMSRVSCVSEMARRGIAAAFAPSPRFDTSDAENCRQ
jgi:hypothetical protein